MSRSLSSQSLPEKGMTPSPSSWDDVGARVVSRSVRCPGLAATLAGRVDYQRVIWVVRPDDEAEPVAAAELVT
jgi:hypothetical protein